MVKAIKRLKERIKWWNSSDRLGPDIPTTHVRLYFPVAARKVCKRKFASFGENSEFRPGAYAIACSKIDIGNNVVIRPQTMLFADFEQDSGRIKIEDDVLIGSGVHIYVTNHEYRDTSRLIREQGDRLAEPVRLCQGCWIGANVVILPGVTVGRHAVIGANSVVTRDIPEYTVAVGNPAKVIKHLNQNNSGGTYEPNPENQKH